MTRVYNLSDKGRASRETRRIESQQALLLAARNLFNEKGYDGVSVTEIGQQAGVSHTLINAYFGGKAGLLYALVEANNAPQEVRTVEAVKSAGSALHRVMRVLGVWAESDLEDPRILQILQAHTWLWSDVDEDRNRKARELFIGYVQQVIKEGIGAGEFPPNLNPTDSANAIFAIYTWGLRDGVFRLVKPEQLVKDIEPQICLALGLLPKSR